MAEQVLTNDMLAEAEISLWEQELVTESATSGGSASIYVIEGNISPVSIKQTNARTTRRKRGRPRKKGRPRKPKQGGWQVSKYISHEQRQDTRRKALLLDRAGYRFTVFATVRPPAIMLDREAKRYVGLEFARLGQALKRAGQPFVGLRVFEKKDGLLHGHMPLHVRPEHLSVVKKWADRFDGRRLERNERGPSVERHARPYVSSDIKYAMKQHRWCGPECEQSLKFYQKGEPFRGARLSFTGNALDIIARVEAEAMTTRAHKASAPVYLFTTEGQGLLFGELAEAHAPEKPRCAPRRREKLPPPPMLRLFALVTDNTDVIVAMRALGSTHKAIADRLGISRQQTTNILNEQFRPSHAVVRRVLELARAA